MGPAPMPPAAVAGVAGAGNALFYSPFVIRRCSRSGGLPRLSFLPRLPMTTSGDRHGEGGLPSGGVPIPYRMLLTVSLPRNEGRCNAHNQHQANKSPLAEQQRQTRAAQPNDQNSAQQH